MAGGMLCRRHTRNTPVDVKWVQPRAAAATWSLKPLGLTSINRTLLVTENHF